MTIDRRSFLRSAAGTLFVGSFGGGVLAACGEEASQELPAGLAEPGSSIPKAMVKMGMAPNGDELIPVIGIERGYYADAGITITPTPYGAKVDLLSALTPLLNNQIQVGSAYPPTVLPQLDSVRNIRAFALSDIFYGYRILAPEGRYKTVAEVMEEGQPFSDAVRTVMEQMRGERFLRNEATSPTFFNIVYELGGITDDDFDLVLLDNPGVVRAALAGRADFAAPTGAVDILQLQTEGWEPIIEVRQLLENVPDKSLPLRANNSGFLADNAYIRDNYETVLRLTSVMYRIIDDLKREPEETVAVFRDYVNSYTGNDLSRDELAALFGTMYSMRDFDEAGAFYAEQGSDFYLPPAYNAQMADLREGGVLRNDHEFSDLVVADRVWKDLNRYRDEAQRRLDEVSSNNPSAARRAQELMDARNYLDAYRFVAAAAEESS